MVDRFTGYNVCAVVQVSISKAGVSCGENLLLGL